VSILAEPVPEAAMIDPLFLRLGAWLLSPKVRFSRAGYRLRALHQPQHGEDVLDAAVMLLAVNAIEGDVAEFGVFQGRSLLHLWHAHAWAEHLIVDRVVPILEGADPSVLARRYYGFDSFEGLPEHDEVLKGQPDWMGPGAFAATEASVRKDLRRNGVPDDRMLLVPGWFEDTLTATAPPERIALAHIDCDLYSSTKVVLEYLAPRLVDGAIVVFDDWWLYRGRPDKGEQRAFAEFRAAHPELRFVELLKSMTVSFLVHRDDERANESALGADSTE
jgi:O-methyltransferase